jgi:DNA-directed RNA polymerase subunit RPC12/RpoP
VARFIERSSYDWWGTIWKSAIFVVVIIVAIFVVYPSRGVLPTVLIILASVWVWVSLMSRKTGYRCGNCGKAFQVPTTVNFFTASAVGKNPDGTYYSYKQLTCPHCGKRSKARLVKRAEAVRGAGTGKLLK